MQNVRILRNEADRAKRGQREKGKLVQPRKSSAESCEFDKAAGVYESTVSEFPEEAEAY